MRLAFFIGTGKLTLTVGTARRQWRRLVCRLIGHDEYPIALSYWMRRADEPDWRQHSDQLAGTGCRRCLVAPLSPVEILVPGKGTHYVDGIEARWTGPWTGHPK